MRRNQGNELLVALLAGLVLLFAILFALLLASSNQNPQPSLLPATDVQPSEVPATPTATATYTPSATATATYTPSDTATATYTPSDTATATSTPSDTATATSTPSDTATATYTPSATATATYTPSATATATYTPSDTATATSTPSDTATATSTPSDTATATYTPSDTATASPLPPIFVYLIATPTAASADTVSDTRCQPPSTWRQTQVRAGENLLSLAIASGIDLITLREANCLSAVQGILPGDSIALPSLHAAPVLLPTVLPSQLDADADLPAARACRAAAHMDAPAVQQGAQRGIFSLSGRAIPPAGGSYRISLQPAWSSEAFPYAHFKQPVAEGQLALVNPEHFGPGWHRVLLELLDADEMPLPPFSCERSLYFVP